MSLTVVFTALVFFIIGRSILLRWRASRLDAAEFRQLDPAVQLAILKERLLEMPSERNLQNIEEFAKNKGYRIDLDSYRLLVQEQMHLSKEKEAMALDNLLYERQTEWIDSITPFEFSLAKEAKEKGEMDDFIEWSLEGVLRLYSDKKIESALSELEPFYPKAKELLDQYLSLKKTRDDSAPTDSVLDKLKAEKQAWVEAIRELN
ncbi:MAG TPA: hypothetical protein PK366_04415 [Fibrobacteraceae bacterium]|nr:hypothetical protein [Fibrobacteraceae bacterium]